MKSFPGIEKAALRYSFKMSHIGVKNKRQSFQVLFQLIMVENTHDSAQVVNNEYKSNIGRGSFDRLFCHDVRKAPLPFDSSVRVFHNGLSSAVKLFVNNYPVFVSAYHFCVFGAFQDTAVFAFCALGCF